MKNKIYQSPELEIIEVAVESGIAQSVVPPGVDEA